MKAQLALILSASLMSCSGKPGGPVAGAADDHCTVPTPTIQVVDPSVCNQTATTTVDSGPEFGATMYGSEGDDDDCKYHVSWTSTPVYENDNITFSVTLTTLATGQPVTGANTAPNQVYLETDLGTSHPLANLQQKVVESPPGTYAISLVRFDEKGEWLIRYHFFENCLDAAASPHGHAAFYLEVP